jgi:hypothetical protein
MTKHGQQAYRFILKPEEAAALKAGSEMPKKG